MSAWTKIDGVWRKAVLWTNVGGTWRKAVPWINVGGTWRKDPKDTVADLTAAVNPSVVTGAISRPGIATIPTNEATVTAAGGTEPYTYLWTAAEGAMTAVSPTAATTRFTGQAEGGDSASDTFTCTVTDAKAQTATATVQASVYNYGKQLNGSL
jgi:hypothetical protein